MSAALPVPSKEAFPPNLPDHRPTICRMPQFVELKDAQACRGRARQPDQATNSTTRGSNSMAKASPFQEAFFSSSSARAAIPARQRRRRWIRRRIAELMQSTHRRQQPDRPYSSQGSWRTPTPNRHQAAQEDYHSRSTALKGFAQRRLWGKLGVRSKASRSRTTRPCSPDFAGRCSKATKASSRAVVLSVPLRRLVRWWRRAHRVFRLPLRTGLAGCAIWSPYRRMVSSSSPAPQRAQSRHLRDLFVRRSEQNVTLLLRA